MTTDHLRAGAERFLGFGDLYDRVRPVPPARLGELIRQYCGASPRCVVDLGSGTGLSTRWASTWAETVIGVEPSEGMRDTARGRQEVDGVSYVDGWSHRTGLASGAADAVLAVQALHWMEPEPTFREVARLLRPGGVFVAIDCDWPPIVGDYVAEKAWEDCRRQIRVFETRLADGLEGGALHAPVATPDRGGVNYSGIDAHRDRRLPEGVRSWSKFGHLERLAGSGYFAWCREVALTSEDQGDHQRFVGLLKSQGDYQTLRRHGVTDEELGVNILEKLAYNRLGAEPGPMGFVYRARFAFAPVDAFSRG